MNALLSALLRFVFELPDQLLPPARLVLVQEFSGCGIGAPRDEHRHNGGCDG
jgi:hypothetical protein